MTHTPTVFRSQLFIPVVLAALIGIPVGIAMQRPGTSLRARAAAGTATIYTYPTSLTGAGPYTIKVFATVDKGVGFAATELKYDPTKLRLTAEPSIASALSAARLVKNTTPDEANGSGVIHIALGADPSMRASLPTGTMEIASLTFSPMSAGFGSATVTPVTSTSQYVDGDAVPFSITSVKGTAISYPASVTSIPTIQPTKPTTPTNTSAASGNPTIVTPKNGSILKSSGVTRFYVKHPLRASRLQLMMDGKTIMTCRYTSICVASITNANVAAGNHTLKVVATDRTGASKSTSITVKK